MEEYGFTIIKPTSVARPGVVAKTKEMILAVGLKIVATRLDIISVANAEELYLRHLGKDHYPWLIKQMTSGPSLNLLLFGESASLTMRALAGPTDPEEARKTDPHSIWAVLSPPLESIALSRSEERATDTVLHVPRPNDPNDPNAVQRAGAIFWPMYFARVAYILGTPTGPWSSD